MKTTTSQKEAIIEQLVKALADVLLGEKIPLDIYDSKSGEVIIPAGRKILKSQLRRMAAHYDTVELDPSPIRNKIRQVMQPFMEKLEALRRSRENKAKAEEDQFLVDIITSIPRIELCEIMKKAITFEDDFAEVRYEKGKIVWLDKYGDPASITYPENYADVIHSLTREVFRWYHNKTLDILARVRRSVDSEDLTSLGKVLAVSEILELHS